MNLAKVACPNCGASVSVPEDVDQVQCAYCGGALFVKREQGIVEAATTGQSAPATLDSGSQAGRTILGDPELDQHALLRSQVYQDISHARSQLSNVRAEISRLESKPASSVTNQQLLELRQQETQLLSRIARLEEILRLRGSSPGVDLFSGLSLPSDWASLAGCAGLVLVLLLVSNALTLSRWFGLSNWSCILTVVFLLGAVAVFLLRHEQ